MQRLVTQFDIKDPNYSTQRAAETAYKLMFYPQKNTNFTETQLDILNQATLSTPFMINNKEVAVYEWSSAIENSPTALLVHGFGGKTLDFFAIISLLISKGYRVLGFDAPAHGKSEGKDTDLEEFMACLAEMSKIYGQIFDLAIGHSFGTAALTYQMRQEKIKPEKVLLLAPNAPFDIAVTGFLNIMKAQADVAAHLFELIIKRFNGRMNKEQLWDACSNVNNISNLGKMPILVIHGKDDKMFGPDESLKIKESCQKHEVEVNLISAKGHIDILYCSEMLQLLEGYLKKTV